VGSLGLAKKSNRVNSPRFVTESECAIFRSEIKDELKIIRRAIGGDDMRGGIVKDVADLKVMLRNQRKTEELSNRWKATIYGTVITTVGLVIV